MERITLLDAALLPEGDVLEAGCSALLRACRVAGCSALLLAGAGEAAKKRSMVESNTMQSYGPRAHAEVGLLNCVFNELCLLSYVY